MRYLLKLVKVVVHIFCKIEYNYVEHRVSRQNCDDAPRKMQCCAYPFATVKGYVYHSAQLFNMFQNCLTFLRYFWKIFERDTFRETNQQSTKSMHNFPLCKLLVSSSECRQPIKVGFLCLTNTCWGYKRFIIWYLANIIWNIFSFLSSWKSFSSSNQITRLVGKGADNPSCF